MIDLAAMVADPVTYLPPDPNESVDSTSAVVAPSPGDSHNFEAAVHQVIEYARGRGFVVHPWQVAAYVTAVRTKPFVILAGISGTGKSSLPQIVAEATKAEFSLVPVKPDWTDSGELIGQRNLNNHFVPGALATMADRAALEPDRQHFLMLDEMNLARPEYYLAEALSIMETKTRVDGGITSLPLSLDAGQDANGKDWSAMTLPSNLALVGSVNMDETTFGFARKLLDRTFVLEFNDVDLGALGSMAEVQASEWAASDWAQPYLALSELGRTDAVESTITVLQDVNDILQPLQQHVGYRVRDEIALFVENSGACIELFVDADNVRIDPLDLALFMKVLPRIQGSSGALSKALVALDEWANGQNGIDRALPICGERISLMRERLGHDGYASFWV